MPPSFGDTAGDPVDALEARQRRCRGIGIRRLGIVDEQRVTLAADRLHAMFEAREEARPARISSSPSADRKASVATAAAAFWALCAPRSVWIEREIGDLTRRHFARR
jgi:hypothetical protein